MLLGNGMKEVAGLGRAAFSPGAMQPTCCDEADCQTTVTRPAGGDDELLAPAKAELTPAALAR